MTTLTTTLTSICSGGNHLTFTLTGAVNRLAQLDLSVMSEPIDAQARTLLQTGVTVTI